MSPHAQAAGACGPADCGSPAECGSPATLACGSPATPACAVPAAYALSALGLGTCAGPQTPAEHRAARLREPEVAIFRSADASGTRERDELFFDCM